ncbi:unnamed protein product [Symbiodinium necroappetens]|uniref:Uncharacterized protein n=1 Tax=Symbiodinium necroappetens TaxID=1628268 RepID=A0A812WJE7_9DINO|nr:unnamed protein product [Symbiodinium necroappetens]
MEGFVSAKGEELYVEEVRHIRNFDDWLGQVKITLRNCFVSRAGRLAAHSFVYKCRCHLTPREVEQLPPMRRGMEEHDHDVFALTKGRMHITSFHPPALALPRRLAEGTDTKEVIQRFQLCVNVLGVFKRAALLGKMMSWADNARAKAVVEKVKKNISTAVGGSLDPEAFDCIHVIDLIQKKFPEPQHLKHCLEGLYDRAKLIDPAWTHPGTLDAVPMPPGPQQGAIEGWLLIWQFAHEDSSSLKGRSNMVNILEIAFSILENTFNSVQNPLDVLFPAPGPWPSR